MTLRPPTADDVRELGEQLHLDLDESEVEDFRRLVTEGLASYETVRKRAGSTSATISDRSVSGRPSPDSDPLNAWITRCEVSGDADGPWTTPASASKTTSPSRASR
ncbi:hypothetical protein [Salinirarus marinus]|uniref:hypothetical protein n=1 Tax=Salinirarus marinus TaxID=3068310 RepID=UPI003C6C23F0